MINITYKILESMAIDIEKSKIEFKIDNIEFRIDAGQILNIKNFKGTYKPCLIKRNNEDERIIIRDDKQILITDIFEAYKEAIKFNEKVKLGLLRSNGIFSKDWKGYIYCERTKKASGDTVGFYSVKFSIIGMHMALGNYKQEEEAVFIAQEFKSAWIKEWESRIDEELSELECKI